MVPLGYMLYLKYICVIYVQLRCIPKFISTFRKIYDMNIARVCCYDIVVSLRKFIMNFGV